MLVSSSRMGGAALVAATAVVLSVACSTEPTTIDTTSNRPSTFVMPDLRGLYWKDADPLLRAAGWTGVLDRAPSVPRASPTESNRILRQDPPAGAKIVHDTRIKLQFAS